MRHVSWSVVDEKEKEELIERVRKMSSQNKENRRKQRVNHTSGRTSFVVLMERKNQMVQLMNAKAPEARTDEAAACIFREVLGHRLGYSRGLGNSVMPESIKVAGVSNEEYERLAEENEENRKNAEYYRSRVEEIEGGFKMMREHMRDYEQRVNMRMSKVETELESQRETSRAVP
ncbi:uncharacterized protein LOC121240888 [Juglans microcarpa x Juglans regia]|uniref:uncharacterized protein LOC121240888 n=1 Tax=Juglans microcarpa x Juglans regia TaxID=2249226 RepID=UPI001B7DCB4D|nr:uncharacterized protein LOC121240888 [Juglans microcarpa x Juglans regia]